MSLVFVAKIKIMTKYQDNRMEQSIATSNVQSPIKTAINININIYIYIYIYIYMDVHLQQKWKV